MTSTRDPEGRRTDAEPRVPPSPRPESPAADDVRTSAELLHSHDWSRSVLGPMAQWPRALRTMVEVCLASRFPLALWCAPDLTLIYNDAYRPILGAKHPKAFGAPGKTIWPEVWDVIGPMLDEALAGGSTWAQDQPMRVDRHGYSEEVFFTFSYSPVTAPTGEVLGVFAVGIETTERVLGERRLATLNELSTRLGDVGSLRQVCAVVTEALQANHLDHPLAMLVTDESAQDVPPPLREDAADLVRTALATGAPAHRELAGAEHSAAAPEISGLHALPVASPAGTTTDAVVLLGRSTHRRWDDAYATYAALCARHIGTALGAIHERDEQRRRGDNLAALDEAKNAFFTNFSHELRTPLTLVGGPVKELLRTADLNPDERAQLQLVDRNVTRLTRIVDALLDFGRMEAGRLQAVPVDLDVAELSREIVSGFSPAFERARIEFRADIPDHPVPARNDRTMIERIMLNLLTNALKYTPAGHVRLTVTDEPDAVVVEVRDTGVGIAAEHLDRIFQRFEQLPARHGVRTREGAGIGLAMVRELTALLGGTVRVDSEPDRGSTFTVRVPRWPDAPEKAVARSVTPRGVEAFLTEVQGWDVPGTTTDRHPAAPGAPSAADRPRLLIVEDNADMRSHLRQVLQDAFEIRVAHDGLAALPLLRRWRPDIVLADVMMPSLDGLELSRQIRQDAEFADLPLVLLSARAGEDNTSEGLRAGADDYLVKPFSVTELRARLESNLERSRARLRETAWRRAVIESYPDPLAIMDAAGDVVEVNRAFTELLGWSTQDGPFSPPYPWTPPAPDDDPSAVRVADDEQANPLLPSRIEAETDESDTVRLGSAEIDTVDSEPVQTELAQTESVQTEPVQTEFVQTEFVQTEAVQTEADQAGQRDTLLLTRSGDEVWVRTSARRVDTFTATDGELVLVTLRDVTRDRDSRERRRAAAELSSEFGHATDLTQVLAIAVTGFARLFNGDSTVRLLVAGTAHLFTANGPVTELQQVMDAEAETASDRAVTGLLFVPTEPGGRPLADVEDAFRVWVQFPRPRLVPPDELIVGDLLAQAFHLAVDRLMSAAGFADRESQLVAAMESHRVIGQAVGILIERHRLLPGTALERLKKASQDRNIKLRELAGRVIETGEEPELAN